MSVVDAGTAYVKFKPDMSGLNREVAARVAPIAKSFGGQFGKALGPVMAQQSKHLQTFTRAAKYATVGAAGLAAYGLKDVVEAGSQFEKQMDTNSAVSEANRKQMGLLEKQAIKLGKATFFSANETAEAQAELVKGGLSIQKVLGGGLPAALSLAEAGQLDLAVAGETLVNSMGLFGLKGKEAEMVSDGLATAANRTTADVLDFAVAFKQGGSAVKQAGRGFNDGLTVLEALAESGIKNSDAGTSMKTSILQLLAPTDKQAKLAKSLNLEFVDQHGNLKKATELSDDLRDSLGGYSNAQRVAYLKTLAGTDGFRTLAALYDAGPAKLKALEKANLRQGTAQEIAAKKMDNIAGSVEQFKGSIETAEISIYKGMAPALAVLTDEATKAANNIGEVFEDPSLSGGEKIEKALDVLSQELGGIWENNNMTENLVDLMDRAIPVVAEHAGQLGFEAAKGFGKGFLHADPLGEAVMAAWLLHFVAGRAPFIAAGKTLGAQFGLSFAENATANMAGGVAASGGTSALAGAAGAAAGPRWLGTDAAPKATRAAGEFGEKQLLKEIGLTAGSGAAGALGGAKLGGRIVSLGKSLGKGVLGAAGGYIVAEVGVKGLTALGVGDPTEGQGIKTSLTHGFDTSRVAETERGALQAAQRIRPELDEAAITKLKKSFRDVLTDLSVDSITGMRAVNRDLRLGLSHASSLWITGTKPWRDHTAEAMQGAVAAIKSGMQNNTISVEQGKMEINHLLAQIHLVKGNDPFGLAKATAESFKQSNGNIASGVKTWTNKLDQMPVAARKSSIDATERMLQAWAQGHPKIERQIDSLAAYQIRKFGATNKQLREGVRRDATGPVAEAFHELATGTAGALDNIGVNTSQLLKALGVKDMVHFDALVLGPSHMPQRTGKAAKRAHNFGYQTGGAIVPGTGSGDTFRTALPPGSFILNREATKAFGFAKGGLTPVVLEPGERRFLPDEVKAMGGTRALEALNEAVPRLATGGSVKASVGGPGKLATVGHAAIAKVMQAAQGYLDKHQPKLGSGAAFGPDGVGTYKGLPMANWVIEALQYAASKGAAPQPTSGYRSHAYNVAQGRNYKSEHEGTQYPYGAVDFGGYTTGLAAKMSVVNATRDFKYPLLAPIGFEDDGHASGTGHQLGGLVQAIQRLVKGGFVKGDYTVKHIAATATQKRVAEEIMKAADTTGALNLSRVASMMAATQENNMEPGNTFQLTGEFEGISPSDSAYKQAVQWFTKGYYEGGGIGLSKKMKDPGDIAQAVEGSAYPDAYDPWKSESQHWVEGWGGGAGASGTKEIPKQIKGRYTKYDVVKHGDNPDEIRAIKARYKVDTDRLNSFGSLPDNLDACNKELRIRQRELGEYRAATSKAKSPETKRALQANAQLLQARVSALRAQRLRLLRKKATAAALKRIGEAAEFAHWTKPNVGVFAQREQAFQELSERADQAVSLEPEEPTTGTSTDWVRSVLEPYVNNVESPAFGRVLGAENTWRTAILGAETFAGDRMVDWRGQITKLHDRITEIKALRKEHPQAWAKRKDLIPGMEQQIKALRSTILKTRTETLPEWEDALGGVQGLGRSHAILDALPTLPTGEFGGNIFDTQLAIKGLGLKVPQALTNSVPDNSAREQLLEGLLREANQRNLLRDIEERVFGGMPKPGGFQLGGAVMPPYAGKAHSGAIVPGPPTQERTMIVKGREGIFTEEQMAAMGAEATGTSGPPVIEEMHVYPDGRVRMRFEGQEFEAAVRKVTDHDGRRETRGASRGLARAGVFAR